MLVKNLIKTLKELNPNDEIWATWVTKDDVKEKFAECEFTDENDNLIETDKFVSNEAFSEVVSSLDTDDYIWERFTENLNEACSEVLSKLIEEAKHAEQDTELWDTDES